MYGATTNLLRHIYILNLDIFRFPLLILLVGLVFFRHL